MFAKCFFATEKADLAVSIVSQNFLECKSRRCNFQKFFTFLFAFSLMQSFCCAEELEFAQVSDVHYSIDNLNLDRYLYFLSLSVKKNDPDFVIFLGDNVDKSREDDVIGFMRAIHSIKTPYYIVLGKSDAHRLNGLEKEIYLDIVSAFNRNQPDNDRYYYFKRNRSRIYHKNIS